MSDGCGQTQLGLLNQFDHLGLSLKTHLRSGCTALSGLPLTWRESGTISSQKDAMGVLRLCVLALGRSGLRTNEIECGSWVTRGGNLRAACNWPTPTKRDEKSVCASEITMQQNSRPLSEVVGQAAQENPSTIGKPRGSLNAAWVMQLMNWPDDYAAELTRLCSEWQATAGCRK